MKLETKRKVRRVEKGLVSKYRLFMRHRDIAEELGVSPQSLRNTMRRRSNPAMEYLYRNKLRFGRRVRYETRVVAEVLVLEDDELVELMESSDDGGLSNVA